MYKSIGWWWYKWTCVCVWGFIWACIGWCFLGQILSRIKGAIHSFNHRCKHCKMLVHSTERARCRQFDVDFVCFVCQCWISVPDNVWRINRCRINIVFCLCISTMRIVVIFPGYRQVDSVTRRQVYRTFIEKLTCTHIHTHKAHIV